MQRVEFLNLLLEPVVIVVVDEKNKIGPDVSEVDHFEIKKNMQIRKTPRAHLVKQIEFFL
jgi:PII-like signaling protein